MKDIEVMTWCRNNKRRVGIVW